jgi:hypothetical protein
MRYIILLLLFINTSLTWALDENLLQKSYERELNFLLEQKKSLIETKSQLQSKLKSQKSNATSELLTKKTMLLQIQQKNQQAQDELSKLEKYNKEGLNALTQLEKTTFKIYQSTSDISKRLGYSENFISLPDHKTSPIITIENQLAQTLELLDALVTPKWKSHAFLDSEDHLQSGDVLFYGLFSAQGKIGDKVFMLAPYNQHWLKVLAPKNSNQGQFYLFDAQFQKNTIKVIKGWKESLADIIPGLVMALIMITVLGLFINLARS